MPRDRTRISSSATSRVCWASMTAASEGLLAQSPPSASRLFSDVGRIEIGRRRAGGDDGVDQGDLQVLVFLPGVAGAEEIGLSLFDISSGKDEGGFYGAQRDVPEKRGKRPTKPPLVVTAADGGLEDPWPPKSPAPEYGGAVVAVDPCDPVHIGAAGHGGGNDGPRARAGEHVEALPKRHLQLRFDVPEDGCGKETANPPAVNRQNVEKPRIFAEC